MKLFCNKCNRHGHIRDNCFLIKGYPDWWEEKYGSKNQQGYHGSTGKQMPRQMPKHQAHLTNSPFDGTELSKGDWQMMVANLVQAEFGIMMKGKSAVDGAPTTSANYARVNYAHLQDFADQPALPCPIFADVHYEPSTVISSPQENPTESQSSPLPSLNHSPSTSSSYQSHSPVPTDSPVSQSSDNSVIHSPPPEPRRSNRTRHLSTWLHDFHLTNSGVQLPPTLANVVSNSSIDKDIQSL
ncbi:OLC1v1035505C1 [Oldenlandia corymbosa var. corymbosa]|uniref:OLC1v1035505C1 n=1 Tax=Oldenlandia corymbosa var. corymbosa TaxID=529605 RepID=A0AAV1CUC3_OLDCO|nr:OLC1v1035505C1 [Oldenlandia corymbosa var. corymbosa]